MASVALDHLAACVQPLVFETGVSEFPYAIKGTVFLVRYGGRIFGLTARHHFCPKHLTPLCIFPTDSSQRMLPLKDVFFVPYDLVDDDFVDVAVIEIDLSAIDHPDLIQARFVDLTLASDDWKFESDVANFFLFGFPEDYSFVNYDEEMLVTRRVILGGRYRGGSSIQFLHELEIVDTHSLSTFSGLSGAPVFVSVPQHDGGKRLTLCGMALRGTPSAQRVHFLDRSVLLDALKVRCAHTSGTVR